MQEGKVRGDGFKTGIFTGSWSFNKCKLSITEMSIYYRAQAYCYENGVQKLSQFKPQSTYRVFHYPYRK